MDKIKRIECFESSELKILESYFVTLNLILKEIINFLVTIVPTTYYLTSTAVFSRINNIRYIGSRDFDHPPSTSIESVVKVALKVRNRLLKIYGSGY